MNELEPVTAAEYVEALRSSYDFAEQAKQAIELATTFDDVKDMRARAESARQYAKAVGYSRDITNQCAEIKLRAERKAGAILAEMPKQTGGDATKARLQAATEPHPPSYKDLDIEKTQAHRWQQSASIPDKVFEDYVEAVRKDKTGAHDLITASGLRLHAARQRKPDPVAEPVPLPDGKFSCIVADPPWSMRLIEREQRPDQGRHVAYPTMELDEIAKLPVGELAADDAHLYLWVTHKFLPAGLDLIEQWGFAYQCLMTWRKNVGFTPFSWMYDTEHVIFARRGNLTMTQLGLRLSFEAPVAGHSVKPDVFYERVLAASPGPRLEMFARRKRDGFTVWGNEVNDAVI